MAQEPESSVPADRVARSLFATHALLAQIEQVRTFPSFPIFRFRAPVSRPVSGPVVSRYFARNILPYPSPISNVLLWLYAPDAVSMV